MARRFFSIIVSLTLLFGGVASTHAQPGTTFTIYDANVSCDGVIMSVSFNNPNSNAMFFDTLVYDDQHIYMDEYGLATISGFGGWSLFNRNDRGLQTAPLPVPFPKRSRFHVLVTIRSADGIPQSYAHLRVLNCTKGKYEVRHGLVDVVTTNPTFQSVNGNQINNWTGNNLNIDDGSWCNASGGYLSTCSLVISSLTNGTKKMTNSVDIAANYPSSVSGVRLETWGWQAQIPTKNPRIQGIIDYTNGTRLRLRVPVNARGALQTWQYYTTLPVRVRGDISRVRTIAIVPPNGSLIYNYFDNTAVLIYRQSNQFDVTRSLPPLPLPGTPLPVLNGSPQ